MKSRAGTKVLWPMLTLGVIVILVLFLYVWAIVRYL